MTVPSPSLGDTSNGAHTDLLAPAQFAALVAPVVDRLRLSTFGATMKAAAELPEAQGLDRPELMMVGYLRNLVPSRRVSVDAVSGIFTYARQNPARMTLERLADRDFVLIDPEQQLRLGERGVQLAMAIHRLDDKHVADLWSTDGRLVSTLARLTGHAVAAALLDGGPTFRIMAPPDPSFCPLSEAGQLAEYLSALRFHRFDAHIAAWRAFGLSAEEVTHLETGPTRAAIEADTNARASAPFAVLTADERLTLLGGLAALHN